MVGELREATSEERRAALQNIPAGLLPPVRAWVIATREAASAEDLLRDEWCALPKMCYRCLENQFAEYSANYAKAKYALEQAREQEKPALIAKA